MTTLIPFSYGNCLSVYCLLELQAPPPIQVLLAWYNNLNSPSHDVPEKPEQLAYCEYFLQPWHHVTFTFPKSPWMTAVLFKCHLSLWSVLPGEKKKQNKNVLSAVLQSTCCTLVTNRTVICVHHWETIIYRSANVFVGDKLVPLNLDEDNKCREQKKLYKTRH